MLIRRLQQAAASIFIQETSSTGFDITPIQYGALSAVERNPGIDQITLAGLIAYDRTTIGKVVDRLVGDELLTRHINPVDRRSRALHLAPKGLALLSSIAPAIEKTQHDILVGLQADEQKLFLQLLKKATDAVNDRSRAPLNISIGVLSGA